MQLNGLPLTSYAEKANEVSLVFPGSVEIGQITALDGQTLAITSGGADYRTFAGFSLMSCGYSSQAQAELHARFFRKLEDRTEDAIAALDANVAVAQGTAEKAMEAAQAAGTDPQVKTVAKLTVASVDFSDVTATDVSAIPDYIPEWEPGMSLRQNDPVRRNGTIYRASQDIAETQEQYPPETAGESLYYPITIAPDGVIVYRECHGDYDMVRKGEKRHCPGAEGPVYLALEDTAYSPDDYPQNWQLVEEAE